MNKTTKKSSHLVVYKFQQTEESPIQEWHENTNGRLIITTVQKIEDQLKNLYNNCLFRGWVIR